MQTVEAAVNRFDPALDTHTGIVLGIGVGSTRYRNREGKVEDHFFIRPGDDVSVTFPGAGTRHGPSIRSSLLSICMNPR